MQTINSNDIAQLAQLAKLGLDDHELASMAQEMTALIQWVSILESAPTDDLAPLTHPHAMPCPLRHDSVTESPAQTALTQNATQHRDGFFIVPQVL